VTHSSIPKQLIPASSVVPIARVGKKAYSLEGDELDDNFQNADELIAQQRALIDAI